MNDFAASPVTYSLPTAEISVGQRRPALWIGGLFALLTAALAPFAAVVHAPVPGFVPIYQTGVILAYALTAYLLFDHFRECRVGSLLWVGGGALYAACSPGSRPRTINRMRLNLD